MLCLMVVFIVVPAAASTGGTSEFQAHSFPYVYVNYCPYVADNVTTCLNGFRENSAVYRDFGMFTLLSQPDLRDDCKETIDSTKQKAAYECFRNVMITCLPSEWHAFVSPVQNALNYRKYRCQNMDAISSCRNKTYMHWPGPHECNEVGTSPEWTTFKTSSNPDTSMKAFCSFFSKSRDCVPKMYPHCSSSEHIAIQGLYSKMTLPACGSSAVVVG